MNIDKEIINLISCPELESLSQEDRAEFLPSLAVSILTIAKKAGMRMNDQKIISQVCKEYSARFGPYRNSVNLADARSRFRNSAQKEI